jgi:O-acetyl-ADP-ribose deacetylase (regulator of RNase III)
MMATHLVICLHLMIECTPGRGLGGCDTGDAKITKGYDLPSRHVIHTVGPVYSPTSVELKAEQLASCYRTSLQVAKKNNLKTIVRISQNAAGFVPFSIETVLGFPIHLDRYLRLSY